MNFYVYAIRFVDGYYYYGYHPTYGKDPQFDNYYGTPVTHAEKWLTTMYWKEILGLYETFEEADTAEQDLIRPCYKTDPLCLNENCGGAVSPELCRLGGQRGGNKNKQTGQAYEWGRKYGQIAVESGQLAEARKKIDWSTYAERTLEIKKENGRKAVESGQFREAQEKSWESLRKRHEEKDKDGKSILAKQVGSRAHTEKDEDGKSVLARSNGKKAGKLPWWNNGSVEKRSYTPPSEDFVRGRLKRKRK